MKEFVHSLLLRYSMYFNKKYDRVGPLFQGRYKGVFVENEVYLLYLSKYIHLNPGEFTSDLVRAKSSYADFLKMKNTTWVKSDEVLRYFDNKVIIEFNKTNSYRKFVESDRKDIEIVKDFVLET